MAEENVTIEICKERHVRLKEDIKILFDKITNTEKKKISLDLCGERTKNIGDEMVRIAGEVNGSKRLVTINIIIVIAVGIFMSGMGALNKASASKEFATSVKSILEEQQKHQTESIETIVRSIQNAQLQQSKKSDR